MIDIQLIRDNPERVCQALKTRGHDFGDIIDEILSLDTEYRKVLTRRQQKQARANAAARRIGALMREGKRADAQVIMQDQAGFKEEDRELSAQASKAEASLQELLLSIPNIPHDSVPLGAGEADNLVVFEHGKKPDFDFEPLSHWELAELQGLIDFARGAKVTGAGFPFYIGQGARLQRALIQFFLDQATRNYVEVQPPLFVNEDSARGTGQLPDKEGQMYHVGMDGFYPVPTAEVPLTNYYRDEILEEAQLPVKLCAHTPCWRREAGSYGAHVRGLNRLHQFDKVELVQFTHPDRSHDALETMRSDAERLLTSLGLPWRRLLMCTGELGFNQSKQYDLEVWSAAQERWLEVSSISNFATYQARRMNIRFRPREGGKPRLVHTLNGSALALPRIVAALIENNQQADRTVMLPEPLEQVLRDSAVSAA